MRVTDGVQLDTLLRGMSSANSRLMEASQQASSGARLNAPSDDPVAAAQLARVQATLETTSDYRKTIKEVKGELTLAEGTLDSATGLLVRAHELAMMGANGTATAQDRQAMAEEVGQLKAQMVNFANQKGAQGFLFGGTKTDTPPFDATGTFLGNNQEQRAAIGPQDTAVVNVSGLEAFASPTGRNVIADLQALQDGLASSNSAAIQASVNDIDTSRRQIVAARADAGIKLNRLETADSAHESTEQSLSLQRHDLVDVDPVQAYSQLSEASSGLSRAIEVSRSILNTLSSNKLFG